MRFECPIPLAAYDAVTLGHGSGGKLTQRLIEELFLPVLDNAALRELHDGANLPWIGSRVVISTDSYVVKPPFFPGGNIGLLAVHGTANDLAMCGARPRFLSLAFILEEGLPLRELWEVLASIREACEGLGLSVVTGDTKVVERGKGDGIFVNTTGVGEPMPEAEISPRRVAPGDRILLNGAIGEHGMTILSVRDGLSFESQLRSDTAALWPVVEPLLREGGREVHALRDATRGGLASVVNEIARAAGVGIVLEETAIPVTEEVRAGCELLGLDPLYMANEGRFLAFVDPQIAQASLKRMRRHPLGSGACMIGEVVAEHPRTVRLRGSFGGSRVVDLLAGDQLPRIC